MAARPFIAFLFVFILAGCQLPRQHMPNADLGMGGIKKSPHVFLSIERKILLDLPGKRQGEVFRCYLKKDPKVQEITVQLWVTEGSMLFNTDWREHFPASDRISLNELRWRARFDSMNQAVLCPTAQPDELSDVCRRWMSADDRPTFKPLVN